MKTYFPVLLLLTLWTMTGFAQGRPADSVVIRVGEQSKVIFAIKDKKDLETLRHYDFTTLMNDMINKLEQSDSTPLTVNSHVYLKDTTAGIDAPEESALSTVPTHHHYRRTYHTFNMDLGTNNYLSKGKFPDATNQQYAVRPWGSWYVAFNSMLRTHVGGKFFIEWGAGVSWYNFKFQDDKTLVTKTNDGVTFTQDPRDFAFTKSKLTATYLNASLIPMIDFGRGGKKTTIFDGSRVDFSSRGNHSSSFRMGLGPYFGYRIDSYSKQVYNDQDEKHKEHEHDTFYLNNIRYGLRFQMGFRDVDVFFNYDLNKMFVQDKGPDLNAFSFGVTF